MRKGREKGADAGRYVAALYAAFNARAIDEVLGRLHPEVDWPTLEHVFRVRDGLIDRMDIRTTDPA